MLNVAGVDPNAGLQYDRHGIRPKLRGLLVCRQDDFRSEDPDVGLRGVDLRRADGQRGLRLNRAVSRPDLFALDRRGTLVISTEPLSTITRVIFSDLPSCDGFFQARQQRHWVQARPSAAGGSRRGRCGRRPTC